MLDNKAYDHNTIFPKAITNYQVIQQNQIGVSKIFDKHELDLLCNVFNELGVIDKGLSFLEDIKGKPVYFISHGDFHYFNYIYTGKDYYYIDFEFVSKQIFFYDIFFYLYFELLRFNNFGLWSLFKNGYFDKNLKDLFSIHNMNYKNDSLIVYLIFTIFCFNHMTVPNDAKTIIKELINK